MNQMQFKGLLKNSIDQNRLGHFYLLKPSLREAGAKKMEEWFQGVFLELFPDPSSTHDLLFLGAGGGPSEWEPQLQGFLQHKALWCPQKWIWLTLPPNEELSQHLLVRFFQKLLKTLEDPPVPVVVVMANPAGRQIPATLLGRAQKFSISFENNTSWGHSQAPTPLGWSEIQNHQANLRKKEKNEESGKAEQIEQEVWQKIWPHIHATRDYLKLQEICQLIQSQTTWTEFHRSLTQRLIPVFHLLARKQDSEENQGKSRH